MRTGDFLKRLAAMAIGIPLAAATTVEAAQAAGQDPLAGLWSMTVKGSATYHYFHTIGNGCWVGTGNIDENFDNFKFGPTLGSYAQDSAGRYRFQERGWVFDLTGKNVGSFRSDGTITLGASGNAFQGPGTFHQLDPTGKVVYTEPFTLIATRVPV